MISQTNYQRNIDDVLNFLVTNYPEPMINFRDARSKIKYYMTKHTIMLTSPIKEKMDEILQYEINSKPILDVRNTIKYITVIQHDITQINAAAIVNAVNADGLGCFDYEHKCIDNVIHRKAGPGLRVECGLVLGGNKIPVSGNIITRAHNLPSKYVIHALGPIYDAGKHDECAKQLSTCYFNCMTTAEKYNIQTIVFPCISTGVYGFPKEKAAEIAINAVRNYHKLFGNKIYVIFCTYTDEDYEIYKKIIH